MNKAKNLLAYFVLIVAALFLTSTVSAADFNNEFVNVDDVDATNDDAAVVAGETVVVDVSFTSNVSDSDVRVKVEIDGEKSDSEAVTERFDVEAGKTYRKALALKVPFDLDDEVSDDTTLEIEVEGKDSKEDFGPYTLRVQRPSYNAELMHISAAESVKAGKRLPVDILLRNKGYNNLDDLFVSVEVPGLGIEDTKYFGDLVAIENDSCCDDDDEDTVLGRFYLMVPFEAKSGVYAVNVEVRNEDTTNNEVLQVAVQNDFPENLVVESSRKSVSVGEEATYELTLLNPTNDLKVYKVVTESSEDFNSEVIGSSVVAVPAGLTKTVTVSAVKDSEGEEDFTVSVLSGESLTGKASLSLEAEGSRNLNNPIVALTVILAIVFAVLLIVLIVLLTKRPEKAEEFGESYY